MQLLTPGALCEYLERVQLDIGNAEHFVLVTAFATSDGIALLEPAMRKCLASGGQGTLVLALDRQHFNAAEVFMKIASLAEEFPNRLEVRVVREHAGLLHAKAVFTKLPDGAATLLVGSANLTERAFTQNHELGLWVNLLGEPEVSRKFQQFAQNLGGTRQNAADLRFLANQLAGIDPIPRPQVSPPVLTERLIESITGSPPQPPISIETFVGDWLRAGSIVGRGRRGLDVLVIHTPVELLEQRGLIEKETRKKITQATEKIVTAGYGVRLLPDQQDSQLREVARKTRGILGKLTLNLPCFGLWMPKAYWDLFQQAAAEVQAKGISIQEIQKAAQQRRSDLDQNGISEAVAAILVEMKKDGLVNAGREDELRATLLSYFSAHLERRTPDLIARAVGFRTSRQTLASDVDLRALARSFFADLVQATFAATYRTGLWPKLFRSFVGRELAARIANRCSADGADPNATALRLLDLASGWEDERLGFERMTAEVNELLGEVGEFPIVTMSELLHTDPEGGDSDAD